MMLRSFLAVPVENNIAYSPATVAQLIAEGLYDLGHDISFFGPEGTNLRCDVVTCNLRPTAHTMESLDEQVGTVDMFADYTFGLQDGAMAREMLDRAKAGEFDCVVFHHFESALPLARLYPTVPIVYILHDELDEKRCKYIEMHASPNQYFISISDSQRRDAPDLNYAATIYNGIDTDAFTFEPEPEKYLMYSGRVTPAKGLKEAVQVAMQSSNRLMIAGNLSKQDYWYFDEHVKPYLNDKVLFLGMLGREQLVKYYQKARALLVPIQWQEPFGLVMAEANACGTPVIAFNRGAVPEVIKDGKTGFIVDNSAEMILAIEKLDSIDRRSCHIHATKNFSRQLMVKNYERVLAEIIIRHGTPKRRIRTMTPQAVSKEVARLSKKLITGKPTRSKR